MFNISNLVSYVTNKYHHFGCRRLGKLCVHCETEIAERAAFAVAEDLVARARDIEKAQPEIAKELFLRAKEIHNGSWYDNYDKLATLEEY